MNTDIKEIKKGEVKTDSNRYIKSSRREGVKNIFDAIVEILTNCGDSYHRIWRKNPTGTTAYGRILIEFFRSEKKPFLKWFNESSNKNKQIKKNTETSNKIAHEFILIFFNLNFIKNIK